MHFSPITTLVSFLPLLPLTVHAQYPNKPPSSSASTTSSTPATTTSSSSSATHTIAVGNGGFTFSPNSLTAAVGEILEFHFYAPLHSVAQGIFSSPCSPLNSSAFFSGAVSTSSGSNSNVFTVIVNDTNPIWVYCGVPGHCESGMAGVINPPTDGSQTIAQYQSAAAGKSSTTPAQLQGGVLGPVKAAGSSSSSTSSASSTGSTSKPSAGAQSKGGVKWIYVLLISIFSVGVGTLMV